MNHMKEAMICKYCGKKMELDDVDFNFKGNQDNFWVCDNCNATAFEKIRYGKSVRVDFQEGDVIKEYTPRELRP